MRSGQKRIGEACRVGQGGGGGGGGGGWLLERCKKVGEIFLVLL